MNTMRWIGLAALVSVLLLDGSASAPTLRISNANFSASSMLASVLRPEWQSYGLIIQATSAP